VGLTRAGGSPDRIEAESLEFHRRVRAGFLALAGRDPDRYLVVDASGEPVVVHQAVVARMSELLPSADRALAPT